MTQISNILKETSFIPAVVCFLVREDEVLLMERLKTSLGLGQHIISGVGGKVGDEESFKDETHEEALIREVQEEINVTPTQFKEVGRVRFIWTTKPAWNMDVKVYIVTSWEGAPKETAVAKPTWFKISNLPTEAMWEDNKYWVPKVLAGELVDAVFLYEEDKTVIEHKFY